MRRSIRCALTQALLAACAAVLACSSASPTVKRPPRTGADRVLVVINTRSEASDSVGEYYAAQRHIARSHIVRIDVGTDDDIGELEFRRGILAPVKQAIDALPERIDFILLTTGVPLRIGDSRGYSVDAHLAGMRLAIPPMVGLDSVWLSRYRNPYYGSQEPFSSERFDMYLVTRLACAQVADCNALVDRAAAAKAERGPFFFDATPRGSSNNGYAVVNRMLYAAATRLRAATLEVQIDSSAAFVAPLRPVMGYVSWGSNDGAFDAAAYHAVRFLPGALAETFVSTSARTFGPTVGGQSRIVDLITQGVTGVKGYVSEPYVYALANPEILFARYLSGATLAEAFYSASRMVLWKDVVIGDPLCAPYVGGVTIPSATNAAPPRSIRMP